MLISWFKIKLNKYEVIKVLHNLKLPCWYDALLIKKPNLQKNIGFLTKQLNEHIILKNIVINKCIFLKIPVFTETKEI